MVNFSFGRGLLLSAAALGILAGSGLSASAEEALNIYTTREPGLIKPVLDEFTKETGIKVNTIFIANGLEERIRTEGQNSPADLIITVDIGRLAAAKDYGVTQPVKSEALAKVIPAAYRDPEGHWFGIALRGRVVYASKERVKQDTITYEELADPKWKGRVSMELGDVDWFTAMHDYYVEEQGKSEEEFTDLMTKIASNSQVAKGHSTQGELLAAGQFDITVSSYSHTIDKAAADGAPVAWKPQNGDPAQPLVVRPNGIGLVKTATNPCSALLFVDYELTGGQEVFADNFRIGSIQGSDNPLEKYETYPVPEKKLLDDPDTWNKAYEDVVANGQALE